MNIYEPDWDELDEDAFEGPDAYVEGDEVDEDIGDTLEMHLENAQDDGAAQDDGETLPISNIDLLQGLFLNISIVSLSLTVCR